MVLAENTDNKDKDKRKDKEKERDKEKDAVKEKDKERDKEKEKERKKLPDLDKYWRAVKDDPADFTGWTYLLQYVDNEVHFFLILNINIWFTITIWKIRVPINVFIYI